MKRFFSRLGRWLLDRAAERSTWAGVAIFSVSKGHEIPGWIMDQINFWGPFLATGLVFASEPSRDDKPQG